MQTLYGYSGRVCIFDGKMGTLYLIPSFLGESDPSRSFPDYNTNIINSIKYFVVEDLRTARRFLKKVNKNINIDELHFEILNKSTKPRELSTLIEPLLKGESCGIISEAGCPGIADPGADLVHIAHNHNVQVVPLIGPSSILLSLMASGFNGQSFAFVGYIPVKPIERKKRILQLEKRMYAENQTQLFIEAPYRNNPLLKDLIATLGPNTRICVACDVTTSDELILSKKVSEWKGKLPDLHKRPAMFLIYK